MTKEMKRAADLAIKAGGDDVVINTDGTIGIRYCFGLDPMGHTEQEARERVAKALTNAVIVSSSTKNGTKKSGTIYNGYFQVNVKC